MEIDGDEAGTFFTAACFCLLKCCRFKQISSIRGRILVNSAKKGIEGRHPTHRARTSTNSVGRIEGGCALLWSGQQWRGLPFHAATRGVHAEEAGVPRGGPQAFPKSALEVPKEKKEEEENV